MRSITVHDKKTSKYVDRNIKVAIIGIGVLIHVLFIVPIVRSSIDVIILPVFYIPILILYISFIMNNLIKSKNKLTITEKDVKGDYKGLLFYGKIDELLDLQISVSTYTILRFKLKSKEYVYYLTEDDGLKVKWFLDHINREVKS